MKCIVIGIISSLLVGLSSAHVIQPTIIQKSELDQADQNQDTLVFAHIIFRHGERDIPKSIDLTDEGKRQLYDLGKYFRRRYGPILGNKYSKNKVYIISTDHDRAIMSAQANLAGLFYPTEDEQWTKDILWQPVPVHTLPREMDNILRPRYDDRCPRYDKMYDWYIEKSPEALNITEKYGDLFPFWAKMSDTKIRNIEDVFSIYKKLIARKGQGEKLPQWALEAIQPNSPMDEIAKLVYKLRGTKELVRIRSGFLLKEMLKRFKKKIKSKLDPDLALYIYSAHSSTVTTLLNGLDIKMKDIPKHGFSFQFELYKDAKDEYYLQLYLRNPDQEHPEPTEIPGCGTKCTLDEFYKIYDEIIPGKFNKECQMRDDDKENNKGNGSGSMTANMKIVFFYLFGLWVIRQFF